MLVLPVLDRILPGRIAHFLACGLVFAVIGGAGYLTVQALRDDARDPLFQGARKKADAARERALFLAGLPEAGIPPEGSAYILRHDPLTHGRAVLERRCLGCHVDQGRGSGTQTASDLSRFGSRAWVRSLLENPKAPAHFGRAPQCTGMVEWKKSSKLSARQLDDVADFVASFARIPQDMTPDEWITSLEDTKPPGQAPFEKECGTCHVVDGLTEGGMRDAPNLFAWGSPRWIARMVRKPGADDRYGFLEKKDQMPAFGPNELTQNDVEMVIRYLRDDYPRTNQVSDR
jgi:ubiquinol-cytochrome c reductase cytochrome b subunit